MNPPSSLQAVGSADLSPPTGADVLAGVVLRPPVLQWDGLRYTGARLRAVDEAGVAGLSGLVRVVREGDFVGVVAFGTESGRQAAVRLRCDWSPASDVDTVRAVWQSGSAVATPESDADASAHMPRESEALTQAYRWPATADAGSAWAVAWWHGDGLSVWCAAASIPLRRELAALTGLPVEAIRVLTNGQSAHSAAFDVAADATLLSRAVGRAVRVSSADAPAPRPVAGSSARGSADPTLHDATPAASSIAIQGTLADDGRLAEQVVHADGSTLSRPSLARLLAGGVGTVVGHGRPPYRFDAALLRVPANARVALAGAGSPAQRAAQVFAQESFIDEAAAAAGADPVAYRLRHLDDPRGAALVQQVAAHASWTGSPAASASASTGDAPRPGRGFAYASVVDDSVDPPRRSWSAWVADVAVDPVDGSVDITRVVVGHDLEHMQATPADAPRIEDEVRQTASQLLQAPPAFDDWGAPDGALATLHMEAGTTAVASATTAVSVPTGVAWSDAASLPAAAAVANAIFDATGVRLREPPFNGAAARAALTRSPGKARRRVTGAWLGGIAAATAGLIATAMPWKAEIAPVTPDLSIYSAAAIDRGRLVAAAGDCVVCHTAPGGAPNAGGLKLDTPFGQIVTTNITPDPDTGIGRWSFAAFDRAMRQGVHRDGRQLYPAFPYTSFAKLTDADMQGLYAYLMTQPAVTATPPATKLAFPFNIRPLMAGWNVLFHDNTTYQPDDSKSTVWNRGAYLVQGIGHCGACHTPRNALGAEKTGAAALLAGGDAEGWEAPALNALSRSPIPWTEDDFFSYLRTGFSAAHGVAAGPMAPVVQGLADVPDQDVRAMAVYLASLNPATTNDADRAARITAIEKTADSTTQVFPANGERIFEGACAVCHETRNVAPLFGVRPPLALNTNLHSDRPDNLIQVILNGIADPAAGDLGYMPAFGGSLNDTQVVELVEYMRARYASDKPAWQDVAGRVESLRQPH
jgi:nicotinate dehydrogenase subunit B